MSNDLGHINLFSGEHKRDPFPFYANLRATTPVAQLTVPVFGKLWLITRYADVVSCLKDHEAFVKDPRNAGATHRKTMPRWLPASIRSLEQNMLDTDDPDHRRLRALVSQAFSRRGIKAIRERIDAIAQNLLAEMPRSGILDLVKTFALPFPLTVICELLGVPVADQQKFRRWSAALLATTSQWRMALSVPSVIAFIRYLKRLFQDRRANPGDDLVSALIEAEENGDRLSENELIAMIIVLIIAGHETTVNLIASGTLALLENPVQKTRLIGDRSLMPLAIEELLRFAAPVETATERYAVRDIEIGGAVIRRGDLVFAAIASANRDETVFSCPDELDLSRKPNPHIAFGEGMHYCLGHQLARLEAEIAFTRLFDQLPGIALAQPAHQLTWRETPVVRGLSALPVSV